MNNETQKFPETSMEAYKALQPENLRAMYTKIVEALKILGTATYEELSDYLGCQDRNQVSRRLKEMEGMQLIWKPGAKKLTKRRRNAFVYQLTNSSQPKTELETNYRKEKSSTQFANEIIESAKNHGATQLSIL